MGAKEWKFDLEVSVAVCVISEFYHCQSRNQKGPFRVSLAVALLLVRDSLRRTRQMHSQENGKLTSKGVEAMEGRVI